VNDVKDLVALLKGQARQVQLRIGRQRHRAALRGRAVPHVHAGTSVLHVPYKGSAPAVTDTIGGQTQIMFPSLFTAIPYVKSGKLKPMGVAGNKRSALLPDVPTLKEQGIADVDVSQWYAIFAPAKTPKAVIDQLNKALNAGADRQGSRKAPRRPWRRRGDQHARAAENLRPAGAGQVEEGGGRGQAQGRLTALTGCFLQAPWGCKRGACFHFTLCRSPET
jgi:hypothetical protein